MRTGKRWEWRFGWIALLLSLPTMSLAQQIAIGRYPVPTPGGWSESITAGPDGAMWFTEGSGKIGRITSAGATVDYPVPGGAGVLTSITAGPDGALWFTAGVSNNIGRITTDGVVTEYLVPTDGSDPVGITAGPDGALWFTEFSGDKIGRISTTGVITEYSTPTANSQPYGIAVGPDGALWFTEYQANKIGRITTAGNVTEYPLPTVYSFPIGIALGPDRALWFVENLGNKIGRITTAGVISEYPVPTPNSLLVAITPGPDGALWFTEMIGYKIGRITTAGMVTEYPIPSGQEPDWIAAGPHGEIWFTQLDNYIGETVFVTAGLTVSPSSGYYASDLTFTGSGFAPNESVQIYAEGVGSAVLATATADASGSFSATAREPQSPYGPRLFLGVGQSSGGLGAASFSVTPRLILNPKSGTVGSTITAQGYGFGSFELVTVLWKTPLSLLGTASANADGTFNGSAALTITVPTGARTGVNVLTGKGQTTGAKAQAEYTVQ